MKTLPQSKIEHPEGQSRRCETLPVMMQNAFFTLVVAVFLLGVLFVKLLFNLGVELPPTLEAGAERSSIEGRVYQQMPNLSLKSFVDGSFQSGFDKHIADTVPARSFIVRANATQQRWVIEIANTAFSYPAIPTHLSSSFVIVPESETVVCTTVLPNNKNTKAAHKLAKTLAQSADAHPDIRFVYDCITDVYSSPANPTHDLCSRSYGESWARENILDSLGNRFIIIEEGIDGEEELLAEWFHTEPHWRLTRALESYNKMGEALGWSHVEYTSDFEAVSQWWGSSARIGLFFDYSDDLRDMPVGFPSLTCSVQGEIVDRGARGKILRGEKAEINPHNAYHSYYGTTLNEVVYSNEGANNGRTCLFIEQSYGPPLEPYIASNYATTICVDPLNANVDFTMEELIDRYNPDDVVVQFGYTYLSKGLDYSPRFFELER